MVNGPWGASQVRKRSLLPIFKRAVTGKPLLPVPQSELSNGVADGHNPGLLFFWQSGARRMILIKTATVLFPLIEIAPLPCVTLLNFMLP